MRHFVKTSVATAVVGAAMVAAGSASAGIVNTKHNLGASGTGPNTTGGTNEICIFCHTPHGGDTGAAVPLWNKQLSDPAQFTTYDQLGTSTLDAAVDFVGSVSLACLTCHDGTQAIDNIRNAPGSGLFDATGGGVNGRTGAAWAWTSTDSTLNAEGQFVNSIDTGGTNIWMLGTDLRNDHPVSMQYAGGPAAGAVPGDNNFRDVDFNPVTAVPGVANRWFVDNAYAVADGLPSAVLNGFDKWDFKLYTRDTSTGTRQASANGAVFAGAPEPFVECGSCHDPHYETTTFLRMEGDVNPADITRMSNRDSKVCLTCHAK